MKKRSKWKRVCAGVYECGTWRISHDPVGGRGQPWFVENSEWPDDGENDSDVLDEEALGLRQPGDEYPSAPTFKEAKVLAEKLMLDEDASRSMKDAKDLSLRLADQGD